MYVAVPQHGVNHVTMAQQQMGLAVAQVNVIHIMRVADGFADDRHLRAGHVVKVPYQMVAVARRLQRANRDARYGKSGAEFLSWWLLWLLLQSPPLDLILATKNRWQVPLMPGPLSSIHQNFTSEQGCNACHAAHGSGALGWLEAAMTKSGPSDNCTNCHQFKNPVNGPHNSALISASHPGNTSCTMCHTEHKGADANIVKMDDAQCNSCHKAKFASFATNHKEFSETYPFGQRTAIAFNHSSHFGKHFKDARYSKNAPAKGCVGCHNVALAERNVPVRGFDDTCAGCHQDTVAGREFVMFTFPEFEENPIDIEDIIESPGGTLAAAAKATQDLQGEVEKLAETTSSASSKAIVEEIKTILADLGDRVGSEEADEEFEPISSETLSPVSAELLGVNGEEVDEYAEATKTLVEGVLENGVTALAELVGEAGGNPDTLLRGLSNSTVVPAFTAWAANKEYEAHRVKPLKRVGMPMNYLWFIALLLTAIR